MKGTLLMVVLLGLVWPAAAQERVNGNPLVAEAWRKLHERVDQLERDQATPPMVVRYVQPVDQTALFQRTQMLEWLAQQQRAALERQQQLAQQQAARVQRQSVALQQQQGALQQQATTIQSQVGALQQQSGTLGQHTVSLQQHEMILGQQATSLQLQRTWLNRLDRYLWFEALLVAVLMVVMTIIVCIVADLRHRGWLADLDGDRIGRISNDLRELREELRAANVSVGPPRPAPDGSVAAASSSGTSRATAPRPAVLASA